MPAIERVIPLVGQLPVAIRDALARRVRELAGLSLVALSAVFAAALMTWSVQDPSLSHATSRAIRNIAGYPGAICDALVLSPAVIFGPPGFLYRLVLGSILFAAAIATFLIASGIGSATEAETTDTDDDAPFEQEDDDASVSLGWAFHAAMSAKA